MLNEKQQRLKEILENNINNEKFGIAVAITGAWGIGKTYFWNDFLKKVVTDEQERRHLPLNIRLKHKNIFDKKYAYVSLFGIESLADLKTAIALKMSSNSVNDETTKKLEIPPFIKRAISGLRDVRVINRDYGISASAKILESLLYFQVKDAIICFDDFERMSNKLDIKDVMGLANQLKLEKNCQIILILDETKTEEKNKEKYAEYKEKLIDETIKITSVEPLIRENAKDIDGKLVDLMVEFSEKMEIHNFRFFQKVIKLYKHFIEQLAEEVAYSTKEIILIRVIQGYFIEDFGLNYEFSWEDIKLVLESGQKDWSKRKIKTYEALKPINYYFVFEDQWCIEYKKWFEQREDINLGGLQELAKSDLISEKNQILKNKLWGIFERRFNLRINESDFKFLADLGGDLIRVENIHNVATAYEFIKKYLEDARMSEQFKQDVLSVIDSDIGNFISRKQREKDTWGYENNIFYEYIDQLAENYQKDEDLKNIISNYLQYDYFKEEEDKHKLKDFLLNDWYQYLTVDIYQEKFFLEKDKTIIACLRRLSKIQVDDFNLKNMIIDVLNKIGEESEFKRKYMQDIIQNHLD